MTEVQAFSAGPTMNMLRDFQRRTVDHVFSRLYDPVDPAMHFLVADEVGLGKTMVARGVIARTIEHLKDKVQRIDIIYICSNAAIARQNIARLSPIKKSDVALATRLTLLPLNLADHGLSEHRINLISFTPDTSLNMVSRGGTAQERALIYWILGDAGFGGAGLRNVLQGTSGNDGWDRLIRDRKPYDKALAHEFVANLRRDSPFLEELNIQCELFGYRRKEWPREFSEGRYRLIGQLRHRLAVTCLGALEPDLIILDEFQRFRDLLTGDTEAAQLAQGLFDYTDAAQNQARTLLLSATPYRMPLQEADSTGDHYDDFIATLGFLCKDPAHLDSIKQALGAYRAQLYNVETGQAEALISARDEVQRLLHRIMVRTERVGDTNALDAMVREISCDMALHSGDVPHGTLLEQLASELGARGAIDYWKSAAYPLAFMNKYELSDALRAAMGRSSKALQPIVEGLRALQPTKAQMKHYAPLPIPNARLRALSRQTVESGLAHTLWLCPSLAYYRPEGPWARVTQKTKSLVFSQWDMVPNSIAALLSYEAERQIRNAVPDSVGRLDYRGFRQQRGNLRSWRVEGGKPQEMSQFTVLYPCVALATAVDPLRDRVDTLADARRISEEKVTALTEATPLPRPAESREDVSWHWALLARLDNPAGNVPASWFDAEATWLITDSTEAAEISIAADIHLRSFAEGGLAQHPLGQPPADHREVLAEIALGSPAVCALRALGRIAPEISLSDPGMQRAAGVIAQAFRTLFNRPEAFLLLSARSDASMPYWRQVLRYCADGNLQAVLDEYVHVLVENLGLFDTTGVKRAARIAEEISAALTIQAARVDMHQIKAKERGYFDATHAVRCRFAMRLGEMRDEADGKTRLEQVRQAFNSPFWPFVLASTSVGQEGLDFHPYCHSVWHWNLPTNPVDMEQREGRVHRYKGHAVRKNIASRYGADVIGDATSDPWERMFAMARQDNLGRSELIPYWVFETPDGASVERYAPILPFSSESGRYRALLRTLALYRLAFGQPRQEDLINWLKERLGDRPVPEIEKWRIDLAPPCRR
jgi:hypothetical protein